MLLSENFKKRLLKLAGILAEANDYAGSEKRVPFNKDMMIQAIKEGREVGISFQSNNEKYKMPIAKWRVIYPVAIGMSEKGNQVIRAFHKYGQSEKEAIRTGKRSAEVENAWRLMKTSNIKAMWFTGNFFRGPLEAYNPSGDKSMVNIEVQANFNEIISFQDNYIKNMADKEQQLQKRKNIVHLFKNTGERPLEQPYANPGEQPDTNQSNDDNNNNMIKESYKKRLQQLAGILNENASVGADGTLYNFTHTGVFIPGDKQFKFSVTYQEVDPGDGEEEVNDFSDQGFEIEPTVAPLSEIIENGVRRYYTSEPSSTHINGHTSWSSHPDTDYRTGVEKTYSLHIEHADGQPLSDVEAIFINSLLKNQSEWEEPYENEPGEWR